MRSVFHPTLKVPPPPDRCTDVIAALDPGPNFGFATYHPFPAVTGMNFDLYTWELGKDGHINVEDIIVGLCHVYEQARLLAPLSLDMNMYLIIEKFEFRKDDQLRDKIDFTAAEYVGVAKFVGWKLLDDHVIMQGSSEAKAFWTDDKLRALGLYGDTRHSRDALRHVLKYMTFKRRQRWLLNALKEDAT